MTRDALLGTAFSITTAVGVVAGVRGGEGPPLLLLHANPGDHRDFAAVIPTLQQYFHTVAIDWPGYGRSTACVPETMSAVVYATLLEELVQCLALGPVGIIGNSVGGFAAAQLAIRHPAHVAALVLVNSGGFTRQTLWTRAFCRLQGHRWSARLGMRRFAGHYLRVRTPTVQAMLARAAAGRRHPEQTRVYAAVWRSFADPAHDLRRDASRIVAPTLLAWGRHDILLPLEHDGRCAARAMPDATLAVFDTGHAPFAEAPADFLAQVVPFLRRHLRAPAVLTDHAPPPLA